jgi:hypothetical protein
MYVFPHIQVETGPFGAAYCTGAGEMVTQSDKHIKGCEFRVPVLFSGAPAVSASVLLIGDGVPIHLYSVKVNSNVDGQTQIVVYAQTWSGEAAAGFHVCSMTASGMPL